MVGELRTDLIGPTSTLEIGKYDKLIYSIMLWEYHFFFYVMMMEENVTSMLPSMTKMNSLSDPTATLRKIASHEPADVA